MVGYPIRRTKMMGDSKGGNAPVGTRLCVAKCSVLYHLSVWLRKVRESLVRVAGFEVDKKSLVSVFVIVTEAKLF